MAPLGFRRSTVVDAAVNLVPFAILVAFLVLFLAVDPWRPGRVSTVVSVGVLVGPIVVLLLATGAVARLIQADETGTTDPDGTDGGGGTGAER